MSSATDLSIIHQRNALINKIFWFGFLLGLAAELTTDTEMSEIIVYVSIAGTMTLVSTLLVIKRWLILPLVYIHVVGLSTLAFTMVLLSPSMTMYLIMYFVLAVLTLYHDYRPLLVFGGLGLAFTNYFYFQYQSVVFASDQDYSDLINLNLFFVLINATLTAQAVISDRTQREVRAKQNEALLAKSKVETIFKEIKSTIFELTEFNHRLQDNVRAAGHISREVTGAFGDIAAGIGNQSQSVAEIGDSLQGMDRGIQDMKGSADSMKLAAESTSRMTVAGDGQLRTVAGEMEKVGEIQRSTATSMEELRQEMEQIGRMTEAIEGISGQTNLLSLNASIEAARAGESGKGFSVVAGEIRKLAEESNQFAQRIAGIVNGLIARTNQTAEQVAAGLSAVEESRSGVRAFVGSFEQIRNHAEDVLQQAALLDDRVGDIRSLSVTILEETTSVSAITEQSAASVQEVTASVEEQDRRIDNIVQSFHQLEKLVQKLDTLSKE